MRVPTRSAGTRSGVNCRRLNEPPSTSATVLTVSLLADDHPLDLEERRLQRVVRGTLGPGLGVGVERVESAVLGVHGGLVLSGASSAAGSSAASQASP